MQEIYLSYNKENRPRATNSIVPLSQISSLLHYTVSREDGGNGNSFLVVQ
jgi:hypothetical protein